MRRPLSPSAASAGLGLALLAGATLGPSPAAGAPGDTTWVATFAEEFVNWATPHYATFTLPPEPADWQKVVMRLTIGCPGFPDDCDPWDRLGHVRVVTPDQGDVEIARFVTPYDITISGGPGTCVWTHNVTPWKSLLQDEVELRLYIESWIGGSDGWLVTIDFAFIEGELAEEPYRVVNLWQDDFLEYGNPDVPVESQIAPVAVPIPGDAERVEVRVFATGHGQGNTDNCAEFCPKEHTVVANGSVFSHTLWRSNCFSNPCSPQGGTWSFARAGWCPGAAAPPWTVDVTPALTPGAEVTLEYRVEPYENLCRPNNPSCVSGVTCPDCNYNTTGHTVPHYTLQASAILYKARGSVTAVDPGRTRTADGLALGPAAPNPFAPATAFRYSVPRAGEVSLLLYDAAGRIVREERRTHPAAGEHSFAWDGRDRDGAPVAAGVYFYSVRMAGESLTRKMIRVR